MDLVADAVRVDHQAGILAGDDAGHADVAGRLVDGDVGDPGRPRRAVARKLAVHIERIGKAPPAHDIALGNRFLPVRTRRPAGALGNGVDEIDGALVLEIAQAIFDRIDAGFGRQFVDIGFMGKGVRQRRDAAKPRGAHDRRHVVRHHAHVVVVIGRDRGAVAHLEYGGDRRDARRSAAAPASARRWRDSASQNRKRRRCRRRSARRSTSISCAVPFGSQACSCSRVNCTRTGRPTARDNRSASAETSSAQLRP